MRLHVIANATSDWTTIKIVASAHQSCVTTVFHSSRSELFRAHEFAKRASEIGLHENVARFRDLAARQKDALGVFPLSEDRRTGLDVLHSQLINGKPIGQLDRGLDDLRERLCPKLIESRYTSIENGRHCCCEWTS